MAERGSSGNITDDTMTQNAAYRHSGDLKPLSAIDAKRLLNDMRADFISKVGIEQSGLLDELIACRVVTDMDSQSLCAVNHPTPIERAKHLWSILYSIDCEVFIKKALPVICQKFGFIIPAQYWKSGPPITQQNGQQTQHCEVSIPKLDERRRCTRCAIMGRVRPSDVADFLFKIGMIDFPKHRDLTANARTCPPDWDTIFCAFSKIQRLSAKHHERDMAGILRTHSLHVPPDLATQMLNGFPCRCCRRRLRTGIKTMRARRLRLSFGKHSTCGYGSISSDGSSVYPDSDSSVSGACSSSLASSIQTLKLRVSSSGCTGYPEIPLIWHSVDYSDRDYVGGSAGRVSEEVGDEEETSVKQLQTDSVGTVYDNNVPCQCPQCCEDQEIDWLVGSGFNVHGTEVEERDESDMSILRPRPQRPRRIPLMRALRDGLFESSPFSAPDLSPVTEESPSFTSSDDGDEVRETVFNIIKPRVESMQALTSASSNRHKKYVYATFPRSTKAAVSPLARASYPQTQPERAGHDKALSNATTGAETSNPERERQPSGEQQQAGASQERVVEPRRDTLTSTQAEPAVSVECIEQGLMVMEASFRTQTLEECQEFDTHFLQDPQHSSLAQESEAEQADSESQGRGGRECTAKNFDVDVLVYEASEILQSQHETAMQNTDIQRLCDIAERDVSNTDQLSHLLHTANIVEAETRRFEDLIIDLSIQEGMLSGISKLVDMLTRSVDPVAPFCLQLQKEFKDVLVVCQGLLHKRRAFIMCIIHLNSASLGTIDLEQAQLEKAAIDLLLLIESNMYDVYARIHGLTQETCVPGVAESKLDNTPQKLENSDLKRKFLKRKFQIYVLKFLNGF